MFGLYAEEGGVARGTAHLTQSCDVSQSTVMWANLLADGNRLVREDRFLRGWEVVLNQRSSRETSVF